MEDFLRWIDILLEEARASVLVNGKKARRVRLRRSVRQGDPLAPFLFTFLTDLLIHKMREARLIQGLPDLLGEEEVLSLFADDTYLMIMA